MKKRFSFLKYLLLLPALLMFAACSDDDETTPADQDPAADSARYVMLTATTKFDGGYFTSVKGLPSGNIQRTNNQSLQVNDAFGFRVFKNWIFTMTSTAGDAGLQKYTVGTSGNFVSAGFIPNASQFLIVSETEGYYLNETVSALKLQTFNPTLMQRTGEIDLTSLKDNTVEYQAVGKHILAYKEGKVYAGLTYGTLQFQGYEADVYDTIQVAVIDATTKKLDKTIKYRYLNGAGWGSSGNQMWSMGDDGALYIYSTGLSTDFAKSAVIRINAGETDFDTKWIIKASDFGKGISIVTGLAKKGKFYLEVPATSLTNDNGNLQDIFYDYYAVDMTTKQATKITGMPPHHYAYSNNYAIQDLDGKVYFWVRNVDQKIDGYYVLNSDGTSATQAFNVQHDGYMWGMTRLND